MYKFSFIGCSVYYGYNVVGTFQYKDKAYLINYITIKGGYKTIITPTKKEARKQLQSDCKRYK